MLVLAVGPAIVWCAEYIGSGEVVLATRTGAVLGTGVIWAVVIGVFLKYLIGMAGGWYAVATGESMIDLFARLPGPRNAFVWVVLVGQFVASIFAIGSIAATAGIFASEFLSSVGLPGLPPSYAGWAVTLFAVAVAWVGEFKPLKIIMSLLVTTTLVGVLVVTARVMPSIGELLAGLSFQLPEVPEWAIEQGVPENSWEEILPLLGWGAGGFASQVWYTYWVLGAGYGAASKDSIGRPADEAMLGQITEDQAERLVGWRRVITFDATTAMLIGTGVTIGFLIAGAGVLRANELAPAGPSVALTVASLFAEEWGKIGTILFLAGGAAALVSTQLAQVAGWSCLLDDAVRVCLPGALSGFSPIVRRRAWLVFFLIASMTIVYSLGFRPVELVKFAAVVDGLLLTPLQALAVLVGLYWVMPRLLSPIAAERLRPSPWIGVGLVISCLVFSYFCVVKLPSVLFG